MERVNARKYLNEIRMINIAIRNRQRQLGQLELTIGISGISYDRDKISSSPKKDALEMEAIRHLEKREKLQKDIQELIDQMLDKQNEAVKFINQVKSENQKEILMLRYIELKGWAEILDVREVDDLSSMHKLHNRAIHSFQQILDVEYAKYKNDH